ncbi:MAG: hypothetical protein CMI02_15150 [Oceanospirillaceae bacterium]|nr:hypothetical protein [Oceanospirillaceae bacterium]|tara:strand:+ start:9181 stop:10332 length:1152 start_codon:yes stop_codon:yes gene_type:complete
MSNAVTNAFVQSFVADMVKNKVAPPVQVVKHEYPQQYQAASAPAPTSAFGGPVLFEEEEPLNEDVEALDLGSRWGEPIRNFGRQQARILERFASSIQEPMIPYSGKGSYGDPNGGFQVPIGGPFLNWAKNTAKNTIDQTSGAIEAVTGQLAQEMDALESRVDKVVARVLNNERGVKSAMNQARGANSRIRTLTSKVNNIITTLETRMKSPEQEKEELLQSALLSVAQALPGVYSHGQLNGTKHKAHLKAEKAANAAFLVDQNGEATALTMEVLDAAPDPYDPAAMQAIIDDLVTNQNRLLERLNDISEDYYTLVTAVSEAGLADTIADFEAVLAPNAIVDFSKIIPHQISEMWPAIAEGFGKKVLGTPPGETGSGVLGITASF